MRIGDVIEMLRKDRGLSQTALGGQAGLSQTTISDLERGRNTSSTHLGAIAAALDTTVEQIERLASGKANFSPGQAAEIRGYGGHDASASPNAMTEPPRLVYSADTDQPPHFVSIPQYNTGGAMGHGLVLQDQPGIIHGWKVSREWVEKNASNHSGVKNLCIVTGFGDSMRPMFNPGDPLLVDRGVKLVDHEGVYFFRLGDEGFIKRIQRIPRKEGITLLVLSENPRYREYEIDPDMDFEVLGKVVRVWCGTDF